jgi:hypothetical protein
MIRFPMSEARHCYEVRPRNDKRGVDLISDALPFGRLLYGEPNAISKRNRLRQASQLFTQCPDSRLR